MKSLEHMKKKREEYIRKILKIENDVRYMKAKAGTDKMWLIRMNHKWLESARRILAELEKDIKLEEMKSQ